MALRNVLRNLKALNLSRANVSLAIVKEYKRDRVSHYDVQYVQIDEALERRLRNIVLRKIDTSNTVEEYTYDCPELEEDEVRGIEYTSTDFFKIYEKLKSLNPEEDIIEDVQDLVKAKAYLIILRNREGIQVVGFKTLPENWRMRKNKGLIPLLFNENRFKDLEDDNVFSISNSVDILYFNEVLFILSKKQFEYGLNFREGMIEGADEMYTEAEDLNLFVNMDLLKEKVGNNQRYLRKIATIKNLGHYRNPNFLTRMNELSHQKGWNIQFQNGQIVFSDGTIDVILTILQNKRLHSELTDEDFDVESAKPLAG
jgi:hypothetical protein